MLFWIGIALFALSSTWPLERYGREYFAVHQLEFLAIRIVAPMLIALSHARPVLLRGIPTDLRTAMLRPILAQSVVRDGWRLVRKPGFTLLLYVAALFLWAIPSLQDEALSNAAVALLLHLSLFVAGLLFWTRIFDSGAGPRSMPYGVRLMMLWLAMLGQIAIGSATVLKSSIWYPAYGGGLTDETVGGIFLWIPSSIVTLLGLLTVIHMWGRHEARLDLKRTAWSPSNSAILLYPQTGDALREIAAPKNKRMAVGMAVFVLFVFLATMGEGIVYRLS